MFRPMSKFLSREIPMVNKTGSTTLPSAILHSKELGVRQQAREEARANAPPWRRLKWWATGTDPADTLKRDLQAEDDRPVAGDETEA